MKKIISLSILVICLTSCFGPPRAINKSEEEIAQNTKIVHFIQDRVARDTTLSYKEMYVGKLGQSYYDTRQDSIIDNNMNLHIMSIYYSNKILTDTLEEIQLSEYSFDNNAFNGLRDLYISKYGAFSLYKVCRRSDGKCNFYTPGNDYFYEDLLEQGNKDAREFVSKISDDVKQINYIWCWSNSYISLQLNYELGIYIEYVFEDDYVFLDFVLPPKENKPMSKEERDRLKANQSI